MDSDKTTGFQHVAGLGLMPTHTLCKLSAVRVRFADLRAVTRSVTLPAPISATATLAEIAEDLVRGALADHPDEQTISLLAISVSNLEDHSMPSFQPYWGKPAVRNDRGDRGDVGIIRSPVRASILPDFGSADFQHLSIDRTRMHRVHADFAWC